MRIGGATSPPPGLAQAPAKTPKRVLKAVTCHKRGACARGGGVSADRHPRVMSPFERAFKRSRFAGFGGGPLCVFGVGGGMVN